MSQTYEHGAEHSEDVGLDKGHQQFECVHEYHHYEAHKRKRCTKYCAQLACDENHANEGEDNGMATHHIGKQTNHQGKRFGENAKQLNNRHKWHGHFEPCGHFGPKDFFPIFFVPKKIDRQKNDKSQTESDGDVAGDVGAAGEYWYEAEEVGYEDEEEGREQQGGIT